MSGSEKIWFITGASTGFGRVLAEQVLAGGGSVVATARKPEQLALLTETHGRRVLVAALDVTVPATIEAAVAAALEHFGRIDVLVNNAGYGIFGAIEEVDEAEFMPMFDTNVFGLARVTTALLPHFRSRRTGNILNISSIGGLIGSPGGGYYNATKFAVNGLSEALHGELAPLGVHVTIIEPGMFRTRFLGRNDLMSARRISDYDETAGKMRDYLSQNDGKQAGDPVKAAEAMMAVVASDAPPKHLVLGRSAWERMSARTEQWKADLAASEATSKGADFATEGA